MAILVTHENDYGQTDTFYWRFSSFEQLPNRQQDGTYSVPAIALFRSFASAAAWTVGKKALDERMVTFTPSSITANLVEEAYAAFKTAPVPPELLEQIKRCNDSIAAIQVDFDLVEDDLTASLSDKVDADKAFAECAKDDPQYDRFRLNCSRIDKKITELTNRANSLTATHDAAIAGLADLEAKQKTYTEWQQAVAAGTDH